MNDDELLHQLGDALAPEPCPPPAAGLQALHQSIDAARTVQPQRRRPGRRWLLPAVATISALGVGNLALAAAGTSLPRVVRTAAHQLHLPVDSPALIDARHHRDALRTALDRNDRAAIESQAGQLRAALSRLDDGERKAISADVGQLLAQADGSLATTTTPAATDAEDVTTTTERSPTTSTTTTVADSQGRTTNTNSNTDGQVPGPSSGADNIDTSTTANTTNSETTQNNANSNTGQDTGSNQTNGGDQNVNNNQPDPNP